MNSYVIKVTKTFEKNITVHADCIGEAMVQSQRILLDNKRAVFRNDDLSAWSCTFQDEDGVWEFGEDILEDGHPDDCDDRCYGCDSCYDCDCWDCRDSCNCWDDFDGCNDLDDDFEDLVEGAPSASSARSNSKANEHCQTAIF